MSKTAKTTKTTKPATKNIRGHKNTKQAEKATRVQTPIELVRNFATKGLHLGLGLGTYIFEPEDLKKITFKKSLSDNLNSFVTNTIDKGQKVEKEQIEWLSRFEREQMARIRDFLAARRKETEKPKATLEEKIEEVIATLDLPTRQDLERINRRLDNITRQLKAQAEPAAEKTRRKKTVEVPASDTEPEPQNA